MTERENPNPQITMRLAPQANPVDTMITPERYGDFGEGNTKSALQTADELKSFLNSSEVINETAMSQAESTAQEEYLKNKSDWKQFSDKHPFMSHLNPHIQDSFAKVKSDAAVDAIAGEFQAKIKNRPDLEEKEFQALLYQTKQSMYKTYIDNGTTNYDLEKAAIPKLNMMEEIANNEYYTSRAKYKYEIVKDSHMNNFQQVWNKNQGLDLKAKISSLQTVIDNAGYDLNPIDRADIVEKAIQNELYSESQNMSFNPHEFPEIVKNLKIDGKPLSEINPQIVGKVYNDADEYLSRRHNLQVIRQDAEDFEKKQKAKEIASEYINKIRTASPTEMKQIAAEMQQKVKDAKLGVNGIISFDYLQQYNELLHDLRKGAVEDDLHTFNSLITKASQGNLSEIEVIKAANNNLITKHTAEGLLTRDSSERQQNIEKGKGKFLVKAINNYFSDNSYLRNFLNTAGITKDQLQTNQDYWKLYNDGLNQWKSNYNTLAAQAYNIGDTKSLDISLESNLKGVKTVVDNINKKNSESSKPKSKGFNLFDPSTWASSAHGQLTQTAADHVAREGKGNEAVDIVGKAGSPVIMPHEGTLKGYYRDPASGVYAVIDTGNGTMVTVSHLNPNNIYKDLIGKKLSKGVPIGLLGSTGRVHELQHGQGIAHVVVRKNGKRVDPQDYFATNATRGTTGIW